MLEFFRQPALLIHVEIDSNILDPLLNLLEVNSSIGPSRVSRVQNLFNGKGTPCYQDGRQHDWFRYIAVLRSRSATANSLLYPRLIFEHSASEIRQFVPGIAPIMTSVFPALLYVDSAFYDIWQWPQALTYTLLCCGRFTREIGHPLRRELRVYSWESILISECRFLRNMCGL
jgi:hypothetical protein